MCRKKRRRQLARYRREKDVEAYREAEHERQLAHRAKRRERPPPSASASVTEPASRAGITAQALVSPPPSGASKRDKPPMSRAGFGGQVLETRREILELWDKHARVSRASFERDLARILGENVRSLGQVGQ